MRFGKKKTVAAHAIASLYDQLVIVRRYHANAVQARRRIEEACAERSRFRLLALLPTPLDRPQSTSFHIHRSSVLNTLTVDIATCAQEIARLERQLTRLGVDPSEPPMPKMVPQSEQPPPSAENVV